MVVEMLVRRVVDGKVVLSVEMVDTYDHHKTSQLRGDRPRYPQQRSCENNLFQTECSSLDVVRHSETRD